LTGGRANGNLFVVGPDDVRPLLFGAPDHEAFCHVSASRCGRFFVADSYRGLRDPVGLVVGCFSTGRYRTLLRRLPRHARSAAVGPRAPLSYCRQPVRDLSNSDDQGHGQVYACGVPAGFLEGLLLES